MNIGLGFDQVRSQDSLGQSLRCLYLEYFKDLTKKLTF